ncbi:hypothetical protein [Mycoplasmopsis synoviae]|uniref:hypothetical protein n=1 Tax=Mycoplasmopsis synoviae TaxID=2109 RepID=UPI003A5C880B
MKKVKAQMEIDILYLEDLNVKNEELDQLKDSFFRWKFIKNELEYQNSFLYAKLSKELEKKHIQNTN